MKLLPKLNTKLFKKKISNVYRNITLFIKKRPIGSFLVALVILFAAILLGSFLSSPKKTQETIPAIKKVDIYKIGAAPRVTVQAKIEKSGVIKVTALSGGVIQSLNVVEGQEVTKGTNLISMASNYSGGNALLVQASIAEAQYKNVLDTYQTQKDLINKQRDLANKTEENAEELRNISEQSVNETQDLLNLDQDILDTLNQNLSNYTASNSAGTNNALILQTQQLKSQFQGAINGLNQSLRSTKYQASDTNPPADLAGIQKDIALKQLDIQEKTIDLNKEITRLQAALAEINAETMHPRAPISGVVQRIYVKEGQAVSPGAPLMLISGSQEEITAVATVSEGIARNVSQLEESTLYFGSTAFSQKPFFASTEATDGQLFSIQYLIPESYSSALADGDFISIDIPIGYPDTDKTIPFVPLDAIYQSQTQAYLFTMNNGKAVSKSVELGQVYGSYVEIKSGLKSGDQVILNRNIIAGDSVSPTL